MTSNTGRRCMRFHRRCPKLRVRWEVAPLNDALLFERVDYEHVGG